MLNKENLQCLFVRQSGMNLIEYMSPAMEKPVICLYDRFKKMIKESNILILKEYDFWREIDSFNTLFLDLINCNWEIFNVYLVEINAQDLLLENIREKMLNYLKEQKNAENRNNKYLGDYETYIKKSKTTKENLFGNKDKEGDKK